MFSLKIYFCSALESCNLSGTVKTFTIQNVLQKQIYKEKKITRPSKKNACHQTYKRNIVIFGISAVILTCWMIQCLPSAGFSLLCKSVLGQTCLLHNEIWFEVKMLKQRPGEAISVDWTGTDTWETSVTVSNQYIKINSSVSNIPPLYGATF